MNQKYPAFLQNLTLRLQTMIQVFSRIFSFCVKARVLPDGVMLRQVTKQEKPLQQKPKSQIKTIRQTGIFARAPSSTNLNDFHAQDGLMQQRLKLLALAFVALFGLFSFRLAMLGMNHELPQSLKETASSEVSGARPDIVDRNGEILATDVKTMSLFAEPRNVIDKDDAAEQLATVLSNVNQADLRQRLSSKKGFIWIKRNLTLDEQNAVFHLGLPGFGFLPEHRRVYPNGALAVHVLGTVNIDNEGVSGIEKYLDTQGLADLHTAGFATSSDALKPVQLSLDLRATYALRDELLQGLTRYQAIAGAGLILDVDTGEVIAMASLPDYQPGDAAGAQDKKNIDRLDVGVYEMGSTFKALSIAMALESGKVNLQTKLDARENLRYGSATIHDFHATHRMLTVPEVFVHSSNIGTARMALMVGVDAHKAFLRKMGQLTRLRTELPESAEPLVPQRWSELSTITIAFGQGLNVAPMQAAMAVSALVNGGMMMTPTFLKRSVEAAQSVATRVIRPETSDAMRYLMRLNAEIGSAKAANIPGYFVGGKTGTAEKIIGRHYSKDRVFNTFMAITPADKPKYLFVVLYDDPKSLPDKGCHTSACNAGEVTGKVIERIMPILNTPPNPVLPTQPFPLIAKLGGPAVYTPGNFGQAH